MRAFKRRRGMYAARLDTDERDVIAALVADVAELLGAGRLDARGLEVWSPATAAPRLSMEPLAAAVGPRGAPAAARRVPRRPATSPRSSAGSPRTTCVRARSTRLTRLWDAVTTAAEGGGRTRSSWHRRTPRTSPPRSPTCAWCSRNASGSGPTSRPSACTTRCVDSPQSTLRGGRAPGILDPAARRYLVALYGALSWLQESLVDLLLQRPARSRASGRPVSRQRLGSCA